MINFVNNIVYDVKEMGIEFKEVFLFSITLAIVCLIIVLFHYSNIQKEVNKKSRCMRERRIGSRNGVYSVEARNEFNDPLYKVSYDLGAKTFNVNCSCKTGNVVNNFSDLKVYDMRNPTDPIRTIPKQTCQCDRLVEPTTVYYDGYPDLIRFMNNNDTSFFTTDRS